jgi:UDP-N-acetylglucosamine 2-epimerase (non-hydrolysing)
MAKNIVSVVGARPNFLKVAPLHRQFAQIPRQIKSILVHTGQHYDFSMSESFFQDLELPQPHYHLGIGSGTHSTQTARIMTRFEKVIRSERVDGVVVFGDVNSTLACALVCAKERIPLAHVESGLRSFDMSMPEEVNRKLTDQVSDLLFVSEQAGVDNLSREGIPIGSIHLVGNIMIDELIRSLEKSSQSPVLQEINVSPKNYFLMTMHRAGTVDDPEKLLHLANLIQAISLRTPVIFPMHPRTRKNLKNLAMYNILRGNPRVRLTEPKGYLDFLHLVRNSLAVLSDSGGIQAETSYLGVPCLTLRDCTEQPVTVELGTNTLVGLDSERVLTWIDTIIHHRYKDGRPIPLWDGKTAERITQVMLEK